MKVVIIDNYDSFTYNLAHLVKELGADVTAVSDDGCIMGLKHKNYDIHGIQFHPESVLTPDGKKMVKNWLEKA